MYTGSVRGLTNGVNEAFASDVKVLTKTSVVPTLRLIGITSTQKETFVIPILSSFKC